MTPDEVLVGTREAILRGEPTAAIELAERFADGGARHPDVSYNRGLAYVARARGTGARPGDLGRAAAAFEDTLVLRPGDSSARAALEAVRVRAAEHRAKAGGSASLGLDDTPVRDLVRRAPEGAFSVALVGLGVVFFGAFVLRRRGWAFGFTAITAAVAWVGALGLGWVARDVARTVGLAIVVADDTRWVDEGGAPVPGTGLPEAARVEVLGDVRGLVHVRAGRREGWLRRDALVIVERRD